MKIAPNSIFVILGFFSFYIINLQSCISNQDEEIYKSHPVIVSNFVPLYYYKIFKPEVQNRLKLITTYEKKGKDTVCNFLYDGKYIIQLYKMSEIYDRSLMKSLTEYYSLSEQQVGEIYYDNQRSRINIHDKAVVTKLDKPGKIFISLYGKDIRIILKNDSLVDYYLKFKNLSIKYKIDGAQELFANVYKDYEDVPLEILLLKKNNNLYLLFMSPEKDGNLLAGTLLNTINK